MINRNTKIIVASIVILSCFLYYYYYQKNNSYVSKKITDDEMKQKIIDSAKNYGNGDQKYKGIFLYSIKSGKVYLRSTDGNIYKAGNLADCPYLNDPNTTLTSYSITDVNKIYNCLSIPDRYKDIYKKTCDQNPDKDVEILVTSADDFEKFLETNSVGEIKLDQDTCFNNAKGENPITNAGLNPANNINDFVKSNKEKFAEFAFNFGVQVAAIMISFYFAFAVFLLPGIVGSSGWDKTKQSIMAGQMFLHGEALPWIKEACENALKKGIEEGVTKESVELAEGSIIKVAEEIAITASREIAVAMTKLALMAIEAVVPILDFIGAVQMIGMIIDIFDFCHLNNINTQIDQYYLDKLAEGNNLSYNMIAGYGVLGKVWDPIYNYCDYDLEPNLCYSKFNNCKKQAFLKGQKWGDNQKNFRYEHPDNEITADEYCDNIMGKNGYFNKYVKEYLNKLTVNHLGQCIKTVTNDEFADILQFYIPDIDWSQIRSINKDNYPLDLYPKDENLKILSIFIVNQNTYVAEFIKNNFYYFLSLFIIILLIILFV